MARIRGRSLTAPGVVLLALIGAWLGHTLEYARVAGATGLRDELFGSAHVYMLPLAGTLALLAGLTGVRCCRLWLALGHRLDVARSTLRGILRGDRAVALPEPAAGEPSRGARWLALALLLAGLQLPLYLAQENLEAALAGSRTAGLEPITGVHWLAPLVHLAVAVLLAGVVTAASRGLRERTRRIAAVERLVRHLLGRVVARTGESEHLDEWRPSPLDRFGQTLWRRPPPIRLLAG